MFKHFPRQRILSSETKNKASQLLQVKGNKKIIQQQLTQETGKVILLKDLANIVTSSKQGKSRNDLDIVVKMLMERYGK